MAKGNMFLGQASKKLGSVVFYTRNGNQVSRVWTDSGARRGSDASFAARAQRIRFGSISNIWKTFGFVSTRMYRSGKTVNESDYNYFARRNWQFSPYLTKRENELGITMPIPGFYSTGRLGEINYFLDYASDGDPEDVLYNVQLRDKERSSSTIIQWGDNPMKLLSVLREMYPSATKFVYLIGVLAGTGVVDGKIVYTNGSVSWYTLVLDTALGEEQFDGDNNITDWVSDNIDNELFGKMVSSNQQGTFLAGSNVFVLRYKSTDDDPVSGKILPLLFPVNDTASDCYSVSLLPGNFTINDGPFLFWSAYRSSAAFNTAAASYGYTKNVMQTRANVYGNDLIAWESEYVDKLAEYAPERFRVYDTVRQVDGKEGIMKPYRDVCKRFNELRAQCECSASDDGSTSYKIAKNAKKKTAAPSNDVGTEL